MAVRRGAEWLLVATGALLLTTVMTYPMVPQMGSVARLNTGDGLFGLWNVSWVARTIVLDPWHLYDANIFHPHKNALAFSEGNVGAGLLALPGYWLTRDAFVAFNSAMLLGLSLAFIACYGLVRYLTGSRASAVVMAVAFTFCPFIFARTAHPQLMLAAGLPGAMWAFHRLVDAPSPSRGLVLAAVLVGQALMCAYYGIFAAMLMGSATIYFAWSRRRWMSVRYWQAIAIAGVVSIAGIAPFFKPYLDLQADAGFSRTIEDAAMYSADWQAWLASAAWAHQWLHPILGSWSEVLFPGFLPSVFAVAGVWVAFRTREDTDRTNGLSSDSGSDADGRTQSSPTELVVFYGVMALLTVWASLGPKAGLYTVLYNTIPVFSFLRAPGRFGIVVPLCFAAMGGFGVRALLARSQGRQLSWTMALTVLMIAELFRAPIGLQAREPENPAYRMLATLRYGPVAEFPFFYNRSDFPRHASYMLNSTVHWQPLINGYSDHIPQDFRDFVRPLSSFPTREAFKILQTRRARYVVFHLNWYDRRSRERLMERLETYEEFLTPLSQVNDIWLYEITRWP